jgi:hypothetical protein
MANEEYEDDELEESSSEMTQTGWAIAICSLAGLAMIGMVIGFAMGSSRTEYVSVKSNETTEISKASTSTAVNPTPPEPEPKQPEPKKPESKKPEPKKPPVKKEEPKKVDPPKPVEPPPMPTAPPVTFVKDIFPIFQDRCLECHQPGLAKGGLDLKTLASIEKGGDNGKAVVPMKLAESLVWKTIDDGEMPPAGKKPLTKTEIELIKKWIESGAK